METVNPLAQEPSNADGNTREMQHDEELALRSDWGSDESDCESLGDGRPRDENKDGDHDGHDQTFPHVSRARVPRLSDLCTPVSVMYDIQSTK